MHQYNEAIRSMKQDAQQNGMMTLVKKAAVGLPCDESDSDENH